MNTLLKSIWFIAILSLIGCTATPAVKYSKISTNTDITEKEFDSFALQSSIIKLDLTPQDKAPDPKPEPAAKGKSDGKAAKTTDVKKSPETLIVTSTPVEFKDFKIGLIHADSWGISTNLNIAKTENTDLIKEIGVEVSDQRAELIGKIGGVVAKVATTVVGFNTSNGSFPISIKPDVLLKHNQVGVDEKKDVDAGDGVLIDFGALPKDARPIDDLPYSEKVSSLFYSACRSAVVKIKIGDKSFEKSLKISDPRYFQSIGIPLKGKILMHSECGASVVSEKNPGISSSVDIADALVAQGNAIKDAIDAAKKDK